MKRLVSLSGLILLMIIQNQNLNAQFLPEVVSIRELEMCEGVNEIILLNYYNQWCDNIAAHSKGAGGWVMKGDRGERNGEYIFAWTFDFKTTRDYYFPASDWSNYPQWNAVLNRFQFHAPEQKLVETVIPFTDYVVLGFSKIIAPVIGEIIAVRYFDIEPSLQKEFETFVENEFHQAYQENIDGFYNYVLKGNRGAKIGSYMLITVFDSADRRDQYFPVPLGPASDAFYQQWLNIEGTSRKFDSYLPESLDHQYTDYIVVY
ncbi:MAG: hypothetical protein K9H49_03655 [Bacteroidales bacterium]|nr:hypothetical protein [Bacteroidales bacterium]MCF8389386.1 hypothetical protein [Bacteroidales bacterium]